MPKKKRQSQNKLRKHPFNDVAGLWALRILIDMKGINSLASNFLGLTSDGEILRTFGLGDLEDE